MAKKNKEVMRVYFDSEFTGLHQKTTLISIGIITEDGKKFYAEFTDYSKHQVDDWIQDNVIDKLMFNDSEKYPNNTIIDDDEKYTKVKGNSKFVKENMFKWLESLGKDIEFWSDCLSYDWVLFNDLFGTAKDLPSFIYYIPFDICTTFKEKGVDPDISREEFAHIKSKQNKHNALFDAEIIKMCHEKLVKMKQ